ncbi:MAG: hypothetical protein IT353_06160 [Gemmatimonadaceae bacterium]|nr:hypothetical protein [Gemmatimonadaceae bacterium]
MLRRTAIALAVLLTAAPPVDAQSIRVVYRDAADAFEILDHVSDWWPGYTEPAYRRYWADSIGFLSGDSLQFVRYAALREKYYDKRGQGNSQPRRDGSGLFTDRVVLRADPLAAAFYSAETTREAIASLRTLVSADEQIFLTNFYAHFDARVRPLLAQSRRRTAASLGATARTLNAPEVAHYFSQVRRWFGVDSAPFTALYVWWPDSTRISANPNGTHLILRVRPFAGDTVNSADVVAHEAMHVFAATMDDTTKQTVSAAVLDGCTVPPGVRRLAVLEEAIATVLGNMEFRRRFQPRRFQWSRKWYADDWVDLVARLLYPVITTSVAANIPLGADFRRDAAAMCALAARTRGP